MFIPGPAIKSTILRRLWVVLLVIPLFVINVVLMAVAMFMVLLLGKQDELIRSVVHYWKTGEPFDPKEDDVFTFMQQ